MNATEVGAALDRILSTPPFVRSPRLAGFLRYVVQQQLTGRDESPKETEIGIEVFGRAADYDPRIDPVVRVQARLLRFKLHEYYETAGRVDPIRIDLPKGSYRPTFSAQNFSPPQPSPPELIRPAALEFQKPGWAITSAFVVGVLMIAVSITPWREGLGKIWAKTLPSRPKSAQSPAAELYLKGRYYWNKRTPADLQKALDYFTQSIVADAGYARGYVGLADCYGLLREYSAMPDKEAWPRALAAARRAVELDDTLAEAHSTLGFDLFYGSLDLKGGEREFKRAMELNPNYAQAHQWYATALMSAGRLAEASDEMERARELDPGSRSILADQGLLLFYQGDTARAIERLHQVEAAEPLFRSAHAYLSYIYFYTRDCTNLLVESRKAAEASNNQAELQVVAASERGFASGGWRSMMEDRISMQRKLVSEGRYPQFLVAESCAMMGRRQEALEYLQAAYRDKEVYIATLAVSPPLSSLRREAAYRKLAWQLGVDAVN